MRTTDERADVEPPAVPLAPPPAPAAKSIAPPASPAAPPAAFAPCPALSIVPLWWKHAVYPGCLAMPFIPDPLALGDLPGNAVGVEPGTTGQPCSVTYDAFSGQISHRQLTKYDARGRWIGVTSPDPFHRSLTCTYASEPQGEQVPLGRASELLTTCTLVGEHNASQRVTAHRDAAGRITSLDTVASTAGERAPALRITYNDAGDVVREDSGGLVVRFDYTAPHRLSAEHRERAPGKSGKPDKPDEVTYRYDATGAVAERVITTFNVERITYHFVDGELRGAERRIDGEPAAGFDQLATDRDEHARLRMLSWQHLVGSEVHDEQNRVLAFHYADDADAGEQCNAK